MRDTCKSWSWNSSTAATRQTNTQDVTGEPVSKRREEEQVEVKEVEKALGVTFGRYIQTDPGRTFKLSRLYHTAYVQHILCTLLYGILLILKQNLRNLQPFDLKLAH